MALGAAPETSPTAFTASSPNVSLDVNASFNRNDATAKLDKVQEGGLITLEERKKIDSKPEQERNEAARDLYLRLFNKN
jgi:hypothetical protein